MADASDPAPAADAPARRAPDDPHLADLDTAALRHHGDAEVAPGLLDFAVNVQGDAPPRWLRDRLVAALDGLARYPTAAPTPAPGTPSPPGTAAGPTRCSCWPAARRASRCSRRCARGWPPSCTPGSPSPRPRCAPAGRAGRPRAHRRGRRPPAAPRRRPRRRGPRRGRQPDQPDRCPAPGRRDVARAGPRRAACVLVDEAFADAVPGEPESLAGADVPGPARVPQPHQDLGAGRAARRLRPRRPRPAGPARRARGRRGRSRPSRWRPSPPAATPAAVAASARAADALVRRAAPRRPRRWRPSPASPCCPASRPTCCCGCRPGRASGSAPRCGPPASRCGAATRSRACRPDHVRVAVRPAAQVAAAGPRP